MWKVLAFVVLAVAACQPTVGTTVQPITTGSIGPVDSADSSAATEIPSTPTPRVVQSETPLSFSMGEIEVSLYPPVGWQTHVDDQGIVLAEYGSTITQGGQFAGILVYVFIQPISYNLPTTAEHPNKAWSILKHVTDKSRYEKSVVVSQPVGFQWSNHDAAYYLVTDVQGVVSLVIAVISSESNYVVAMYVSTPTAEADLIRVHVPLLFDGLTINGVSMDVSALENLPDPLIFPSPSLRDDATIIQQ